MKNSVEYEKQHIKMSLEFKYDYYEENMKI